MRTYIKVSNKLRMELAERFGLTNVSVWRSLNYLTDGGRAPEVRDYALSHGGAIAEDDFIPNCRTEHTADEIVQTFAGGVQVRIGKHDSRAVLVIDGTPTEEYDSVTVQSWGNLLHHAQEIAEQRAKEGAKS